MPVALKFITPNAEQQIGEYAAICYDSDVSPDACIRRAKSCASKGHLATLRFAHAVFHITGISRACSHQFVRSKHLDFLQQSQRYVNQSTAGFVYPNSKRDDLISSAYRSALDVYDSLIAQGVKKEDARFVLPTGVATELYVVGNLQAWQDFIKLRADRAAQKEIRDVAISINNILAAHCPNLFKEMHEDFSRA
jgi:thymidylate synthase (FAD)